MIEDHDLRAALRAARGVHQPDQERMRARFDEGVARFERDHDRRIDRGRWGGSGGVLVARAASVAVVCGLGLLLLQGAVSRGGDGGAPVSVHAGGAPVTATTPAESPGSAATAPLAPPVTEAPVGDGTGVLCGHGGGATAGPYRLVNDLWGTVDREATGSQCVELTSFSGDELAWSTNWSWELGQGQIKSFVTAYRGWHWGWQVADSGMPLVVADRSGAGRPGLPSRWDFTVVEDTPGRMEVAYDLWFHDRPDPGWADQPVSEVRIVVYRTPLDLPTSGRITTVTIGGATWDVYLFENDWDVVSFFRSESTDSVDLDLQAFLDVAAQHVPLPWLTAVNGGVGVVDGAGCVDTSRFSVTVPTP